MIRGCSLHKQKYTRETRANRSVVSPILLWPRFFIKLNGREASEIDRKDTHTSWMAMIGSQNKVENTTIAKQIGGIEWKDTVSWRLQLNGNGNGKKSKIWIDVLLSCATAFYASCWTVDIVKTFLRVLFCERKQATEIQKTFVKLEKRKLCKRNHFYSAERTMQIMFGIYRVTDEYFPFGLHSKCLVAYLWLIPSDIE